MASHSLDQCSSLAWGMCYWLCTIAILEMRTELSDWTIEPSLAWAGCRELRTGVIDLRNRCTASETNGAKQISPCAWQSTLFTDRARVLFNQGVRSRTMNL